MPESAPMTFVDPAQALTGLPIEYGQKVVDFGCGSGYFSFEFAKRVGAEGQVIALDILPSALEAVTSRAKILGLQNLEARRANLEKKRGSQLLAESVDWVVIKDMLFQNNNKQVILEEALHILRPLGHAFIMEWKPGVATVGPGSELRIPPEELQALLEASGFTIVRELPVGGFHYAFLVKK
jgi:ubiquinone/menaquinone biosynthesis C-methylase UbiE